MSVLDILNEMAHSDGERPFASSDLENDPDVLFGSISDARRAFRFTDEIKSKISIQVAETNVPAEWTEMINSFPETQGFEEKKDRGSLTFLSRIFENFGSNKGAWGGGVATACLVLILIEPSIDSGPTLGAGMAVTEGNALIGPQGPLVQAASETLGHDSTSQNKVDGLVSELKLREQEDCNDRELKSGKDKDLDQVPACDEEVVEP